MKKDDARRKYCPQYKGLSIESIMEFGSHHAVTERYLPHPKDRYRLPRSYIVDLFATLIGDDFDEFVASKIQARHEHVSASNNLMLSLDPAVAKLFESSKAVSSKYHQFILRVVIILTPSLCRYS